MPLSASLVAERVGGDAQVVGHGQLGQQAAALGHHRHAGAPDPLRPALGEVLVAEQDRARRRPQHARHGEHERRLPGAVRPEQRR